jgi:hypothetical protein
MQLTIQVSAQINFSARAAQRRVGAFVADEIGYLLRSGEPTLVVADRLRWRVPIILALPTTGPLGQVGAIDMDAESGQLIVTPEQVTAITHHAEDLAHAHPERPTA